MPLPLVVEGSPAEGFEEEEDESNDPMESLPPIKANDSEQNVDCNIEKRYSLKAVSTYCLGLLESYDLREDNDTEMN